MPLKARTKRALVGMAAAMTCALLAAFAFVFYFMHLVYEREDALGDEAIPAAVREQFEHQFPGATDVVWKFDESLYEAVFHWRERGDVEAAYDADGSWSSTEFMIPVTELPERAQTYLETQAGYDVGEVKQVRTRGTPVTYEAELINKLLMWDCFFDAQGTLVSKERDGPILE